MTANEIAKLTPEEIEKLLKSKDDALNEAIATNSSLQDELESKGIAKTIHWVTVNKVKKRFFNNNTFFFKHPKTGETKEWKVEEAKQDEDLLKALDKKGGVLYTAEEYEGLVASK